MRPRESTSVAVDSRKHLGRHPVRRFVLLFAVGVAAFYAITAADVFPRAVFPAILGTNAAAAAGLLRLLGHDAVSSGEALSSSRFSLQVARGCDGVEPIVLFTCAVLASPVPFRRKLVGGAVGIVLLLLLNFARIITLFLAGVYWPAAFEVLHLDVWQAIFIAVALVVWIVWARRALAPGRTPHVSP